MKETFNYNKVPYRFCMCIASNCPRANTCLRNIVLDYVPQNEHNINILNPKLIVENSDSCKYYLDNQKIRYAKGFVRLTKSIKVGQAAIFRSRLIGYFGRRKYYQLRSGEKLLNPQDQLYITKQAIDLGVVLNDYFDAYVDEYNWG